jgi:hypothetical protein
MWKKSVVAQFKLLSPHLLKRTDDNRENVSYENQCPGQDSNRVHLEYKLGALPFSQLSRFLSLK